MKKLIVTATFFELKPLIDHFQAMKLVAPLKSKRFKPELYEVESTLLAVAGVGPLYSLPYIQNLITTYQVREMLIVGVCGGAPELTGKWYYADQVLINYPGKLWQLYNYHPPVPSWFTPSLAGKQLKTVPDLIQVCPGDQAIYDMEGGFWINLARINKISALLLKKITDSGRSTPKDIAMLYNKDLKFLLKVTNQFIFSKI